jgi:transposase
VDYFYSAAKHRSRGVLWPIFTPALIAAERALRVVALGRKNYLFCGSNAGGECAAAIYSLLGSAKLNGLDPELYLHQVLERIADHPISRIADLLPWNLPIAKTEDTPK